MTVNGSAGLVVPQTPCKGGGLHPHFTDPETEEQTGWSCLLEQVASAPGGARTCRTGDALLALPAGLG